ncbi:MAG: cytochrome P450 [Acidobacteriota bacterium]
MTLTDFDYRSLDSRAAHDAALDLPLESIDLSNWNLYTTESYGPFYKRLRDECPVHYLEDSRYGAFWSITRHDHIKEIDKDHKRFSSEPTILIDDPVESLDISSFIAMDPPEHDVQRRSVSPVVAPRNLAQMESTIRERVVGILESLPLEEEFNWVEKVSIELTTQMLATLFDYPFERRYDLTRWSDVVSLGAQSGYIETFEDFQREMMECLAAFQGLFAQRTDPSHDGFDLLTLMAQNPDTQDLPPLAFLGNLMLLIVGGNDTTRNSITGGVLALNRYPSEYDKLRAQPELIPNMVSEIIRWQTPLAHMRRTASEDVEFHGETIRKGDKVILWYLSGNRDEAVFERADELIIDRPNARSHIAFGFGIHRCMGNRLAEMQLRVLWEEIQKRFYWIEVTGEPVRARSNFVHGYSELPVRVHAL